MELSFQDGFSIIKLDIEKQEKERLWQLYLTVYPLMAKKELKLLTFEEFIKPKNSYNECTKTDEEILEEVERIRKELRDKNG